MKDNFSTTPYMSSNLREYNRIYKEVNDIYRDAASKFGLSNSVFDILYTICEVGEGCLQKDVCDATFIPKQTPLFVNQNKKVISLFLMEKATASTFI